MARGRRRRTIGRLGVALGVLVSLVWWASSVWSMWFAVGHWNVSINDGLLRAGVVEGPGEVLPFDGRVERLTSLTSSRNPYWLDRPRWGWGGGPLCFERFQHTGFRSAEVFVVLWAVAAPLITAGAALWGLGVQLAQRTGCSRCGYPSDGLPGIVCPECGERDSADSLGA